MQQWRLATFNVGGEEWGIEVDWSIINIHKDSIEATLYLMGSESMDGDRMALIPIYT